MIFLVAAYFAFFLAVFFYQQNQALFSGLTLRAQLGFTPLPDITLLFLDQNQNPVSSASVNPLFFGSSFLYFTLAGLFDWGTRMLIESLEERQE